MAFLFLLQFTKKFTENKFIEVLTTYFSQIFEILILGQKLGVVLGQFWSFFEKSAIFGLKIADIMGKKKKFKNLRKRSCQHSQEVVSCKFLSELEDDKVSAFQIPDNIILSPNIILINFQPNWKFYSEVMVIISKVSLF